MMKKDSIDETTFNALQGFIEDITGIYIPENRKYLLEDRLHSVLKRNNIETFAEYLTILEKARYSSKQEILNEFKDLVSTHETSFFRHQAQMKVFEKSILLSYMESIKERMNKTLTVWSAGCSTGEEAYSIAMTLDAVLGKNYSSWNVQVLGTDMSTHVIEKAQSGVYSNYAIRNMPEEYKHYFIMQGTTCSIVPKIRTMVHFSIVNLKDSLAVKQLPECDMIFCRNVLIYFKEDLVNTIVQSFYNKLVDGGLFFVGHSENIRNTTAGFVPYTEGERMIYLKPKEM